VASILAMLYLVIFAALALGFYAQTSICAQISGNDRRLNEARVAAESGLKFIRYQLSKVTIPPGLTEDQVLTELYNDLRGQLDSTPNLTNLGDRVGPPNMVARNIEIPSNPNNYIALGSQGPYFRVRLHQDHRQLVATVVGKVGASAPSAPGIRAAIEVRFKAEEWPTSFFNYGIASKGPVTVDVAKLLVTGTPDSRASILSTYAGSNPVTIGNTNSTAANPTGIEGAITVMQGYPPAFVGNVSVGGQTSVATINATQVSTVTAATAPDFPVADTSVFEPFATTRWVAGQTRYENIYIEPNSNPVFDGTMTVRGVVLVKQPNVVSFQGGVVMQAVIVGKNTGVGDLATNAIRFSGTGVSKDPLSALPADAKFDGLRELTGTFVVAPGFDVAFEGNFGAVAGSVAADRITVSGNTSGSFAASIMTLANNPLTITGSSSISIGAPADGKHSGLRLKERFVLDRSSYLEVVPPP
jgi:hypothetical protein